MLNLFPIQFLAPFAYFLLRVALGFLIIRLGVRILKQDSRTYWSTSLGIIEISIGFLFILGIYTQLAALLTLVLSTPSVFRPHTVLRAWLTNHGTVFLMYFIALSLFITGAGAFAFDLPI